MENFDFGKTINVVFVAFILFMVVMVAFVARMVSTFMAKKNTTPITVTYATQDLAETPIETLHNTTMSLDNLTQDYILGTGEEKAELFEVLVTIAQARKQAFISVIEDNPMLVFSSIFPQKTRNVLPNEVQTFIENEIIIEGRFVVTPEADKLTYTLIARNGEDFVLYFTEKTPAPDNIATYVHIEGIVIDNKLIVQTIKPITY